jgi:serine/threonine-protein kinase
MTDVITVPGFEIVRELGVGGMGRVYLARQLSLNRSVALKVLPFQLAQDPAYVARFKQEAKSAANIKHENIVQVYDAGEADGQYYFVMEYIHGETVGKRVQRKGRFDEKNALLIVEAVAAALEYAWNEASLIHRDVKPDNILVDEDGTVKLTDMGLAKIHSGGEKSITVDHSMIGTPHYCSPEQAKGELEIDFRSDMYSLGATLYHIVTGKIPFDTTSGISAMLKNITDFLPDPIDVVKDLSVDLGWFIEKLMAKAPKDRYRDWADVLEEIDGLLNEKPLKERLIKKGKSTILRSKKRNLPSIGCKLLSWLMAYNQALHVRVLRFGIVLLIILTLALYLGWLYMVL